jgi:hypothetical protein
MGRNEGGGTARDCGDQVGGGERGGHRQIGRDQEGDATVLPVIDEEPVECAANPSYSPHSRDSLTGMVQTSEIA